MRPRQTVAEIVLLTFFALLLLAHPASAQSTRIEWALGAAVGVTHPRPCLFWACDSNPGPAVGVDLYGQLRLTANAAAYVALSRYGLRFNSSSTSAARGGAVGLRLGDNDGRGPWAGIGLIVHQRQFRDSPGSPDQAWSGFGLGTELMGGWALPLSSGVSVSPTVLYRRFSSSFRSSNSVATSGYAFMVSVRLSR